MEYEIFDIVSLKLIFLCLISFWKTRYSDDILRVLVFNFTISIREKDVK